MSVISDLFQTSASNTPTSIQQNTVTPFAQPLAGQILSQAKALGNTPMPAYTGELAAPTSQLQNQAFMGLSNLTMPTGYQAAQNSLSGIGNAEQNIGSTFMPTTFTNSYTAPDQQAIQNYMNPYLSASLAPQLQLLQNQLGQQNAVSNAQLAQAGAYGGGRQAITDTQNALNSNLLASNLIGQGYNTAYNTALGAAQNVAQNQAQATQAQQNAEEAARQFGANFGLQGLQAATTANQALTQNAQSQDQQQLANLKALGTAGAQQQAINQAADTASYNQYLQQLQYPQLMLTAQENAFKTIPSGQTVNYGTQASTAQNIGSTTAGLLSLLNSLGSTSSGTGSGNASGGTGSSTNTLINGINNAGNLINSGVNNVSSLLDEAYNYFTRT